MRLVLASFALALAACGGSNAQSFSCAVDTSSSNTCQEVRTTSSDAQFACNELGGTFSDGDTCPTAGLLGTCDVAPQGGLATLIYIYSGGGIATQADAEAACKQDDGKFTAGQ